MTTEIVDASDPGDESLPPVDRAALWQKFLDAPDDPSFWTYWLSLQCSWIPGTIQGVVVLRNRGGDDFDPVARWPDVGEQSERLAEILDQAVEEGCGLLLDLDPAPEDPSSSRIGIAYPIKLDRKVWGAVALEVADPQEDVISRAMDHLQWGTAWLELHERRRRSREDSRTLERLSAATDLLACVLGEPHFQGACLLFATELASLLQCDRVSIGFVQWYTVRLQALSHAAEVDTQMNLARMIQDAMGEAIFARKPVLVPEAPGVVPTVTRFHRELSRFNDGEAVLTLPVHRGDEIVGALTLERGGGRPFSKEEESFCQTVADLAAPALEAKRQNDKNIFRKNVESVRGLFAAVLGRQYLGTKIFLIILVLAGFYFHQKVGPYKLSVDTVLEGALKRAVVAPFDGFVKSADRTVGDIVDQNELLCRLDDRDLRLKRLNLGSRQSQLEREYQDAFGQLDQARVKIVRAQLEQVQAEIKLVEGQIDRLEIRSPLRGLMLRGDLTHRLGGPVKEGEVLFEISPIDQYRVILKVDESRINDVKAGQVGIMLFTALPETELSCRVKKITPVTEARDGSNYFRVEGELLGRSDRLRPGMEGVAKLYIDDRPMLGIWMRDLREWFKMFVWSWWG